MQSNDFMCYQDCPIGARCNGSDLVGLVNGSSWIPDPKTGRYVLKACPPGYEISQAGNGNTSFEELAQACNLCPVEYYCIGGVAQRTACPDGNFAPAGSKTADKCQSATFVKIQVLFSVLAATLVASETSLILAFSVAAQVPIGLVVLISITPQQARSAESLALADVQIAAQSPTEAGDISQNINLQNLNLALSREGLPLATSLSVSIQQQSASSENQQMAIIAAILGIAACIIFAVLLMYRGKQGKDEKRMHITINTLRKRLHIEKKHGFFLAAEWLPPWRSRDSVVCLHKSCVDAAARVVLHEEFNTKYFDAFCTYLSPSVESGMAGNTSSLQYDALSEMLLEIGENLLKPQLSSFEKEEDQLSKDRFIFLSKLCKCQVIHLRQL